MDSLLSNNFKESISQRRKGAKIVHYKTLLFLAQVEGLSVK
jgi:hypothetical protein